MAMNAASYRRPITGRTAKKPFFTAKTPKGADDHMETPFVSSHACLKTSSAVAFCPILASKAFPLDAADCSALVNLQSAQAEKCRHGLQGHLAPIVSVDDVDVVMSRLLEDPKVASATHNILGYRVLDESTGRVVQVG